MRALCYAQTNIGSGRDNNEDNYYCNGTFKRDPAIPVAEAAAEQESKRLIYGVFDGMGGEANGEQAALLCAQTLHACSSDEPFDALDFFRRANVAVCDMIAASGQISGSTAATVHLTGNRAYCCNVGDSRIYLQRGGALQRISRDHTKYQEQLDAGAPPDAADNPDKHVLTQYLGMLGARQRLMPYFAASVPLAVGDRLLLCTDGLTGKLSDTQLQSALGADLPLPELGQSLMAQALAAGPGDNITLVLIEITALDAETTVPLPQPPAEELSQTRRFEVPAARIAEQETQRRKHAHARRREIILTVAVVLTVLVVLLAGLNVWQYVAENAQLASLEQKVQTRDALIDMQEHQLAQLERQRRELVDAVNYDILGYASPSFYAEKGVVMVNRTLRDPFFNLWADFDDSVEIDIETEGDSVELDFADEDWYTWNVWGVWDGGTVVRITPREPGLTVATFRNSLNDQSFRVFLIVD